MNIHECLLSEKFNDNETSYSMSILSIHALPSPKDFCQQRTMTYREQFDLIDTNKDQKLSKEEMIQFIDKIGWEPLYTDLIFTLFDKNADSQISFLEFMNYAQAQESLTNNPRKFYETLFKAIDKNKNGFLAADEIMKFGVTVGFTISKEDAENLINQAPNKKFNFQQLCKALGI